MKNPHPQPDVFINVPTG